MGDVIHNLPIVADIRTRYPQADIHWLVEESFADIPALHPGVNSVIPVALRRWRQHFSHRATWHELRQLRQRLAATAYDFILDTQGLIKSAWLGRMAKGKHIGPDSRSTRESLAAWFYDTRFRLNWADHAVVRYRMLAAHAFELAPNLPLDYGLRAPDSVLPWLPRSPYAVLLHATSRAEKLWPEADWRKLGQALASRGLVAILPWGNAAEKSRAQSLVQTIPGALLAPRLALREAATLLQGAAVVVGVDTGLLHLASALGTAAIGIYCASEASENGLYAATPIRNLGSSGHPPQAHSVIAAASELARV